MREHGVGWVTGTPALVTAVRSAKQFLTYVASGPFQYAVAEALSLYFITTDIRPLRETDGFAFCKQVGVLEDAAERLRKAFGR